MTFSAESRLTIPLGPDDEVQGPEAAPLTIVEYGDYECEHCAAAHPVMQSLQRVFGDELRFSFRNFPIVASHPHAQKAAEAAEAAAAQGAFWPMHEALLVRQGDLSPELFTELADQIGLDVDRFRQDLESNRFAERVREEFMGGVRSGVNGTPTFFVNGWRYDGPATYHEMKAALDAVLNDSMPFQ